MCNLAVHRIYNASCLLCTYRPTLLLSVAKADVTAAECQKDRNT